MQRSYEKTQNQIELRSSTIPSLADFRYWWCIGRMLLTTEGSLRHEGRNCFAKSMNRRNRTTLGIYDFFYHNAAFQFHLGMDGGWIMRIKILIARPLSADFLWWVAFAVANSSCEMCISIDRFHRRSISDLFHKQVVKKELKSIFCANEEEGRTERSA